VEAVRAGDRGRVRALIRAGADPNAAVEAAGRRLAPLTIALALQDDAIINELLLAGADPATTFAGYSALDIALQLYPDDAPVIRNFLLARRAPAPPAASRDPAGVAWRANAIAALADDPARLLGLALIVAEYRRAENRPDREEVLRRARALTDVFPEARRGRAASPLAMANFALGRAKTIGAPPETMLELARRASRAGALPAGSSDTPGLLLARLTSGNWSRADFAEEIAFRVAVVEEAHRLGRADPEGAGWAVDRFASGTLGARLADPAETIRRNNPERLGGLDPYFRQDAYDRLTMGTIVEDFRKYLDELNRRTIADIRSLRDVDLAPKAGDADKEHKQALRTIAAANSAVYVFATAASFHEPNVGRAISEVGTAAASAAKAVADFKKAVNAGEAVTGAALVLTGDLVGAAMSLFNAFFGGPSREEQLLRAILEQVAQLRQEVAELRNEMHTRFDHIDRQLTAIYDLIGRVATAVIARSDAMRDELRGLAAQTSLMDTELNRLEPDLRRIIEAAIQRDFWRRVRFALEHRELLGTPITAHEFDETLNALLDQGTQAAKDVVARGPEPGDLGADEIYQRLSAVKGLDGNLVLVQYAASALGHTGPTATLKLADPGRWAVAAEGYVLMAQFYPEYYFARNSTVGVNRLLAVGEELRQAAHGLSSTATSEGRRPDPDFLLSLVRNYRERAKTVRDLLADRKVSGESLDLDGYDVNGDANQELRPRGSKSPFGVNQIDVFPGVGPNTWDAGNDKGFKPWQPWSPDAPAWLRDAAAAQKLIPKPFLIAHHLGLGTILVGYDKPGWDENQARDVKPTESRSYAKAGLTLRVAFRRNDNGQVLPILTRRVNTGKEYNWAIAVFKPKFVEFAVLGRALREGRMNDLRDGVAWAHGNLNPQGGASMDPNNPQWIQVQLQENWAGMRDRYETAPDAVPPAERDANAKVAAEIVAAHFERHRKAMNERLRSGLAGAEPDLRRALTQLDGAKRLLEIFLTFGLPRSMARNEAMRGAIFGKVTAGSGPAEGSALPGGADLRDLFAAGVSPIEVARRADLFDAPAEVLEGAIRRAAGGDEPLPFVEATMERLRLLQAMHEAARPRAEFADVYRELRTAVSRLP
jgi:hypothetical protein